MGRAKLNDHRRQHMLKHAELTVSILALLMEIAHVVFPATMSPGEIPATMNPGESPDAGCTLQVSVVSSSTSISVEVGQCPPRIFQMKHAELTVSILC
ncbi:hypothetical protein CJ030_MR5G025395 [Morella rubra]|uniref:Uncharacterized protein n=1 Tax=Morella rubra TaxID=262757 RepID=A0A6A1VJK7_9ROSI|nr:hypothetical protein CJ030_MR5G025396 [Morella rubra]KAB1212017.1 hypothetical protein CJ030_MR5G025395 [Morella rubra]